MRFTTISVLQARLLHEVCPEAHKLTTQLVDVVHSRISIALKALSKQNQNDLNSLKFYCTEHAGERYKSKLCKGILQ
jgi:hypothetical protein